MNHSSHSQILVYSCLSLDIFQALMEYKYLLAHRKVYNSCYYYCCYCYYLLGWGFFVPHCIPQLTLGHWVVYTYRTYYQLIARYLVIVVELTLCISLKRRQNKKNPHQCYPDHNPQSSQDSVQITVDIKFKTAPFLSLSICTKQNNRKQLLLKGLLLTHAFTKKGVSKKECSETKPHASSINKC